MKSSAMSRAPLAMLFVCLCAGAMASSPRTVSATENMPVQARDWHAKQGMFYKRNWGVDVVGVRPVSSGWMLRFDYRVLDAKKARPLFSKTVSPYLIDEATGVRLAVPKMENVGELRQSPTPVANRTYFMIFGNPGRLVKAGSRVSVVIGSFHLEGLAVN